MDRNRIKIIYSTYRRILFVYMKVVFYFNNEHMLFELMRRCKKYNPMLMECLCHWLSMNESSPALHSLSRTVCNA